MSTNILVPTEPSDPTGTPTPTSSPIPEAAPRPRRSRRRGPAIAGAVVAILVVALAGGGFYANASLSTTYGASRAVTDYLAAQSRGDVTYMVANANFLKGDGAQDSLFGQEAVTLMMKLQQNRDIRDVKVTGSQQLDATTSKVTVSMTWAGHERVQSYTVHKDAKRTHYVFYSSWLIDIPASSISVLLPIQAGGVEIDGIYGPPGGQVSVIQGFHTVTMRETDLYDSEDQVANAVDGTAAVTFQGALSADVKAKAADAVRAAAGQVNQNCDPGQYIDCLNHMYKVPAQYAFAILGFPGNPVIAYRTWILRVTGDPTADMKLSVTDKYDVLSASGTCSSQLVVDGKTVYRYTGTWSGTITYSSGTFGYSISLDCDAAPA